MLASRKKRVVPWFAIILVLSIAIPVGVLLYFLIPRPYTGPAILTLAVQPYDGIKVNASEYLPPIYYSVINPKTETTVASGSIGPQDNWVKNISIPEGHPGYVYLSVYPANECYYLAEEPSHASTVFKGRKYWRIEIPPPPDPFKRLSFLNVTVEYVRVADISIIQEGNLTFSGSFFTSNVVLEMSGRSGVYKLTLAMKLNVSGIALSSAKLNGTDLSFKHQDENGNGAYDAGETIFVNLSSYFLINHRNESCQYVLQLTFKNVNVPPNTTITNEMTLFAFLFEPERPFEQEHLIKIVYAIEVVEYRSS